MIHIRANALSLALLTAIAASQAQENYSTNWSGHKNVVVNTTAAGASVFTNVTAFPMLVRLGTADSNIFKEAKGNGADIRFTKANNTTRLQHQIEKWDSAGRSAAVWVRVDTVYGNRNNQHFRIHWGNAAAMDSSKGAAVFDTTAGFRAVWHMNEAGDVPDATGRGMTGVANGSPGAVAGVIGGARSFNGSSSYLNVTGSAAGLNFPAFGSFSISAWVKPTAVTGDAAIVGKGDFAYALKFYRESSYEFFDFQDSWVAARSFAAPTPDTWVHLFAVNTETGPKLYVDGVLEDENPYMEGSGGRNDDWNVNIGREPQANGGRRYFNGVIDEVRMHGVSRSLEWARLEYQTQRAGQTVVTLSDNVPAIDTTSVPGAPTAVTATASNTVPGQATVSWTAPASTGGTPITGYRAVASDTTKFCTSAGATTCTISGLMQDSSYTFTVRAMNAVGMGPASQASASLLIPVSLRGSFVIQVAGNRNPFVFRLPAGLSENIENLSLTIIDARGRAVWNRTVNPSREKISEISWNGKTASGTPAAPGVYVVRVRYTEQGKTVEQNLKGVTLDPR